MAIPMIGTGDVRSSMSFYTRKSKMYYGARSVKRR
jgi:hypothetical protein